jgi:diacylglycerol kinase family enzyme
VTGLDGESITYSLDGEIRTYDSVRFDLLPGALEVKDARSVG